jgi:hypothetical protein
MVFNLLGNAEQSIRTKNIWIDIGRFTMFHSINNNIDPLFNAGLGIVINSSTNDPYIASPICSRIAIGRIDKIKNVNLDELKLREILKHKLECNDMISSSLYKDSTIWNNMIHEIMD